MKKSSKIILTIAIILFIAGAGIGVFFGIQSKQDYDKKIAELENKIISISEEKSENEISKKNLNETDLNMQNTMNNVEKNTKKETSSTTDTKLTLEELSDIEQFLNKVEANGFISHNIYNNIDNINLDEVFYNYNANNRPSDDIINEYLRAENADELVTDLTTVSTDEIKAIYKKYTNNDISNEEIKNRLKYTYLEKYDTYCFQHGDTNFVPVKCVSGEKKSNDIYTINISYPEWTYYYNQEEVKSTVLTLKKKGSSYIFVSNIIS